MKGLGENSEQARQRVLSRLKSLPGRLEASRQKFSAASEEQSSYELWGDLARYPALFVLYLDSFRLRL
jgi:hypothetical protein